MTTRWILSYQDGLDWIEHLNGCSWEDAPPPPRGHDCQPQTRGWYRGHYYERCACGATRGDEPPPWGERNSRIRHWWQRRGQAGERVSADPTPASGPIAEVAAGFRAGRIGEGEAYARLREAACSPQNARDWIGLWRGQVS